MPSYEFRCRTCGATFTESRPMSESSAPAACPDGHEDTVRLLGVAGVMRSPGRGAPIAAPTSGGGCCGGSCGCG